MKAIRLFCGRETIVDAADFEWLCKFNWHLSHGYARTWLTVDGKRVKRSLHQLLMPHKAGLFTDHVNQNKLDNRRANLRYVTKSQNMLNRGATIKSSTGIKGITRSGNGWVAQMKLNGRQFYIGYYATQQDAAEARINFEDRHVYNNDPLPPKSNLQRNNKSGVTGIYVSLSRRRVPIWKVQITEQGRHKHLGTFYSLEAAKQRLNDYTQSSTTEN